ncbi:MULTISPECIES: hypothetical protein [unclassified Lentimonas]|uniref:hypothetical protein n=1 Tax=unclassified Lentimonas TaxID=2630993 RepID=UPI00132880AA|nr:MULTISPECIES: hypothetical protein [unclassified Lentimonas]CAA6691142.1 Unannotated [Lentimonas sp. CC10]CAA6693754.1 Unannotated [Lentimonas sp. CC19]CAA7070124.1 Unannotated [Lentimonas sp. CC11]
MTLDHLTRTLNALLDAKVRMLIAGGLAVLAHGHSRVTHDLDIVLALDLDNSTRAINALTRLGFRPRIPVDALDFCDPVKRTNWIKQKNLMVFSMINEQMEGFVIDIFANEPFDFEEEWGNAARISLPSFPENLPFISKPTLLAMKRTAGRAIDLDDIKHLQHTT